MCFAIHPKDITYRSAGAFDALTVQAGHAKYHLAETSDVYREQDPFATSSLAILLVLFFASQRCSSIPDAQKGVKLAEVTCAKGFGFHQETL